MLEYVAADGIAAVPGARDAGHWPFDRFLHMNREYLKCLGDMKGEDLKNLKTEGGLRTHGEFDKKSVPGMPLISIITVVRNGEKYLEQTIQSVINQTYKNIEYIIIDGSSTDGTLDIIRKYENQIAYWMSEPDSGMYNAMNKGSYVASGNYALFLNSDDYLYREDSIEDLLHLGLNDENAPVLIVGKMIRAVGEKVFLDWVYQTNEKHIHNYNPPHPATLISSSIYKQVSYNQLFKIAGDYDLWETIRQKKLFKAKYVDIIVSVFRLEGVSNIGTYRYLKDVELEISRYIHYGDFSLFRLIKSFIRANIKKALLSIMGARLYYGFFVYNKYRFQKLFLP
jgi:glycosyltransferase involved in cell wall biosynthesis